MSNNMEMVAQNLNGVVVKSVENRGSEWFKPFALYQSIFDKKILVQNLNIFLGNLEELEVDFKVIKKSFKDAIKFSEDYLKLKLSKQIKNEINDDIKNKKDLENFLKKTVLYKKESQKANGKGNLGIAPQYSLITKIAIVEFLYHKDELQTIINEAEYVYNDLICRKEGVQNFFIPEFDESYDALFIFNNDNFIKTKAYWRGKRQDSIITKLLNKKEFSIEEAIKDGIGFKFEVENSDDAIVLMKNLATTFVNRYNADNFVIKNVNFLTNDQKDKLCSDLENNGVEVKIEGKYNPNSNDNFKTLKIAEGTIVVPKNGESNKKNIKRGFEVQIILVDNKNETGLAHHAVYEGKKKLNIANRLLGLFDEGYLDSIVKEASQKSRIKEEKIKEYYLKDLILFTNNNGRKKYLTKQLAEKLKNKKKTKFET